MVLDSVTVSSTVDRNCTEQEGVNNHYLCSEWRGNTQAGLYASVAGKNVTVLLELTLSKQCHIDFFSNASVFTMTQLDSGDGYKEDETSTQCVKMSMRQTGHWVREESFSSNGQRQDRVVYMSVQLGTQYHDRFRRRL